MAGLRYAINDEIIAIEIKLIGNVPEANIGREPRKCMLLYNRWTFQLVDAISFECKELQEIFLPKNGVSNIVVLVVDHVSKDIAEYHNQLSMLVCWNVKSGRQRILATNVKHTLYNVIRESSLLVYVFNSDSDRLMGSDTADVYRESIDDGGFELFKCGQKLDNMRFYGHVPGCGTIQFFGMYGFCCERNQFICQIRSRRDFRLLHQVNTTFSTRILLSEGLPPSPTSENEMHKLLDNCFIFALNVFAIEVRSAVDDAQRILHKFSFKTAGEVQKHQKLIRKIYVEGDYLFAKSINDCFFIWKLPKNFFTLCYKGLREGASPEVTRLSHVKCVPMLFGDQQIDGYGASAVLIDESDNLNLRFYHI